MHKASGRKPQWRDAPELNPTAALPSERFEAAVRRAELEEVQGAVAEGSAPMHEDFGAGDEVELELMFPGMDAALVRAIRTDAPSVQSAIETLLALSAAAAEPQGADQAVPRAPRLPPIDVGVKDHEKFPVMVDADGWQVANFDRVEAAALEEELGSAWCDRAKAVADLPAPKAPAVPLPAVARRKPRKQVGGGLAEEPEPFLTEYEYRHEVGQRQRKLRTKFSKGRRPESEGLALEHAPEQANGDRLESDSHASDEAESEMSGAEAPQR